MLKNKLQSRFRDNITCVIVVHISSACQCKYAIRLYQCPKGHGAIASGTHFLLLFDYLIFFVVIIDGK